MRSLETTGLVSRCFGDRQKEEVLAEGGLHNHGWLSEEVSRSHSTWGNELPTERYRTHKQGRTERKWFLISNGMTQVIALEKRNRLNKNLK
ncbi:hypothetical protein FLSI110296_15600 [Flavobacterium sinopsychrotolerans]|uniref:Uncharacterized protein n=1 Tax=Flavobacterium sinopsychrotolerans TaxID=604089 RepID=A0A1H8HGS8_9FLAO|nr:hypothetical protein SAMN04487942_0197 [Flavobacterium sinopsychrotolerans]